MTTALPRGLFVSCLVASLVTYALGGCSSDSPATPFPPAPGDDGGADSALAAAQAFSFTSPSPGEIVAPGDALDLRVLSTAKTAPTLLVNEAPTQVTWTQSTTDPTLFTARYTVPANAQGTVALAAVGATPAVLPDFVDLVVAAPLDTVSATVGAADVDLKLPSTGAVLHIPANAIQGGAVVTFSSYDPATEPALAGASLLAPLYRVHSSADETQLVLPMTLTQPLTAQTVASFGANDFAQLDAFEGPDPDVESLPFSMRMPVQVKQDGSGVISSTLPPDAFHHTGSSATLVDLAKRTYPFGVTKASVEGHSDADNSDDIEDLLTQPTVQLSNAGNASQAHVQVTATVEWKDASGTPTTPPAFQLPLKNLSPLVLVSPLSAYRYFGKWKLHDGVDLRAKIGTPIYAMSSGELWLNMGDMNNLDLVFTNSAWAARYLHVSKVNDTTGGIGKFSQDFAKDKSFGTDAGGTSAKAPAQGKYALDCNEVSVSGGLDRLECTVSNDDGQHTLDNKGCAGDRSYCIVRSQGIWHRTVKGGEAIGESGSTKATAEHLHLEIHYKPGGGLTTGALGTPVGGGVALDAALFFDTAIAPSGGSPGPTVAAGNTDMIRFAAQLDKPSNLLGPGTALKSLFDFTTNPPTGEVACPYDNNVKLSAAKGYAPVRMTGDNSGSPAALNLSWDLGPCIWTQVHTNTDVSLSVGPTYWRRGGTSQEPLPNVNGAWLFYDGNPLANGQPSTTITNGIVAATTSNTALTATIRMCDSLTDPANCPTAGPLSAKSFENMKVTVQGVNGEFATSTMTITKVTSVVSLAAWQAAHPNEAGTLSSTLPNNAQVYTFLDNAQPAGVVGFPSVFGASNFANRNGRSNLIAVWQDQNNKWQWVMNISGGSYTTGGGFPQWHEYQFIYDSRPTANPHNHYDVYLGANAMGSNFSFIRTAKTSVTVTPIPKQLKPFQP